MKPLLPLLKTCCIYKSSSFCCPQYPAMKWLVNEDEDNMYDARMRDWYIKSAASAKV